MPVEISASTLRCDIFCNVIDNYGDIGVCWRLARQLANEHGLQVRLWVDDLGSFAWLCPEADAALDSQQCRGVEVRHWIAEIFHPLPTYRPPSSAGGESEARGAEPAGGEGDHTDVEFSCVMPAELVIEAFACKLPRSYLEAMAEQQTKPVWVNLEYLSAEDWVEGCHKLPSPHPALPLTKYFFFPGFTRQTGGLLLERDLLVRRDKFQSDAGQQQAFWRSFGMEMPAAETLKISLFAYENAALDGLFDVWASGMRPVLCLVPEGRILPQAGRYFGDAAPCAGKAYTRGNLQVRVLPFVEQERYDELLWACDVNFVRGEDSCVRAQWAGKPFIWQIYPQHDAVHLKKLEAILILYCKQLSPSTSEAVQRLWRAWNEENGAGRATSTGSGQAWPAFVSAGGELGRHAQHWAQHLAGNNLALNLLDFYKEIGRMRAFRMEGQ
ncbi:MAG: elongation factor P maturation arginine rhamnosyltransferase EarP [Gallionella sp.]